MANDNETGGEAKQSKSWGIKNETEAREILCRSVMRARRVKAHSMVRDHSVDQYAKPTMRIEFRNESSGRIRDILPDQEVFESLAARVRPCFLKQDPIYLDKVFDSIDLLLNRRHLSEKDSKLLDDCRNNFRNLLDKEGGHYFVRVFDEDGNPKSVVLSDFLIGDGWLYGGSGPCQPKWKESGSDEAPVS